MLRDVLKQIREVVLMSPIDLDDVHRQIARVRFILSSTTDKQKPHALRGVPKKRGQVPNSD